MLNLITFTIFCKRILNKKSKRFCFLRLVQILKAIVAAERFHSNVLVLKVGFEIVENVESVEIE